MGNLIASIEKIFCSEKISTGEPANQTFTDSKKQKFAGIFDCIWQQIFHMLMYLYRETNKEAFARQLIRNVQSLINMSGSIGLKAAVQGILSELSDWELPSTDLSIYIFCYFEGKAEWETGFKYIFISRIILDIALNSNKILDNISWAHILRMIQRISEIGNKEKHEKLNFHSVGKRMTTNLAKYTPKEDEKIDMITEKKRLDISAGTGEDNEQIKLNFEEKKERRTLSPPKKGSSQIADESSQAVVTSPGNQKGGN